jgi:hypothetical protein
MSIYIILMILAVLGAFIHLFAEKGPKTFLRFVKLLLLYQLFFSVGVAGLLSVIAIFFLPDLFAARFGWPAYLVEKEMLFVHLSYAILGLVCFWREDFWLATIVGLSIWLVGDAIRYIAIDNAKLMSSPTPDNWSILLVGHLGIPLILWILYAIYIRLKKRKSSLGVSEK